MQLILNYFLCPFLLGIVCYFVFEEYSFYKYFSKDKKTPLYILRIRNILIVLIFLAFYIVEKYYKNK